jgi:site-specific DNA-methyltransferase (adenine-specific)
VKAYYSDDSVTLYHGDSRDVLPSLAPESFDIVVTSPPYNLGLINTSFGNYPERALGRRGGVGKWDCGTLARGYEDYNDAMPQSAYEEWQKKTLSQLWLLIHDAGAIFYNHKPRVQGGELWTPLVLNPGLPVRQIVIWKRAGGVNFSPSFYVPTHEWVIVFAKPAWRLKNKGASGAGDVWEIAQESGTPHPAPFPETLPLTAIETTGAKSVLDPFCGWGTSLVAAKRLGAKAVGIERAEKFCEMAAKRLSQGSLSLQVDESA